MGCVQPALYDVVAPHYKLDDLPRVEVTGGAPLKLQVMSDTHVEFGDSEARTFSPSALAPVLALVGDIGWPGKAEYTEFVYQRAEVHEVVLLVAGNHEHYGGEYYSRMAAMHAVAAASPKGNVYALDRTGVMINGCVVLGCTFWSFVPPSEEKLLEFALNDYRCIHVDPDPMKPRANADTKECGGATEGVDGMLDDLDALTGDVAPTVFERLTHWSNGVRVPSSVDAERFPTASVKVTNAMHARDRAWLEGWRTTITEGGLRPLVVLTHHVPTLQFPNPDDVDVACGFHTDAENLLGSPVALWCFGHTHTSSDGVIRGTRLVSNQMGYGHEYRNDISGFRADLVLTVGSPPPPAT